MTFKEKIAKVRKLGYEIAIVDLRYKIIDWDSVKDEEDLESVNYEFTDKQKYLDYAGNNQYYLLHNNIQVDGSLSVEGLMEDIDLILKGEFN